MTKFKYLIAMANGDGLLGLMEIVMDISMEQWGLYSIPRII
jgi:hypothetical protein